MRKVLSILITVLLFNACAGNKKADVVVVVPPPGPDKVALVLPANNEPCNNGTNVTATSSTVAFSWQASANASSYELNIKNLLTSQIQKQTGSTASASVTLVLNTPYSWYVVSKANGTTKSTQSDTWKFYNSGPGVASHAPYPAELLSPAADGTVTSSNGMVTLTWKGSDADNDIHYYDVYLGTTTAVSLLKASVSQMKLDNVPVMPGKSYYWSIITFDINGNSSKSETAMFKVK